MAVDSIHCNACGATLDENPSAPVETRLPCAHCGSLSRRIDVTCSGTLSLHSKLNVKARHAGEKRPFMDQTVGDDLHRKSGRWMKLYRLFDRVRVPNWYDERVTDPATGEVVHECSEPLPNHRGPRFIQGCEAPQRQPDALHQSFCTGSLNSPACSCVSITLPASS